MLLYSIRLFSENRRGKGLCAIRSRLFDKRRWNRKRRTNIQRAFHIVALLIEHPSSQINHEEDVIALMLSVFVQTPSVAAHVETHLPTSTLTGIAEPRTDETSARMTDRLPGRENESRQGRKQGSGRRVALIRNGMNLRRRNGRTLIIEKSKWAFVKGEFCVETIQKRNL